jgi:activator of 2-hydroxyglutaryl-CoA dehydratase
MRSDLVIGMDVGSTTVKAVVVHPETRADTGLTAVAH